ncbi:hypothetical protein TeGR_g11060 [Tetraparma gracilis]|uniref:Uncharacterized protein n=1 Tax=Tetraparma gracilis TaxID=2962635 RepID=A0ABQ6MZ44_9STRA|nr:hypothetical protein TeGR_g11060 [Tetraparma gracilis]
MPSPISSGLILVSCCDFVLSAIRHIPPSPGTPFYPPSLTPAKLISASIPPPTLSLLAIPIVYSTLILPIFQTLNVLSFFLPSALTSFLSSLLSPLRLLILLSLFNHRTNLSYALFTSKIAPGISRTHELLEENAAAAVAAFRSIKASDVKLFVTSVLKEIAKGVMRMLELTLVSAAILFVESVFPNAVLPAPAPAEKTVAEAELPEVPRTPPKKPPKPPRYSLNRTTPTRPEGSSPLTFSSPTARSRVAASGVSIRSLRSLHRQYTGTTPPPKPSPRPSPRGREEDKEGGSGGGVRLRRRSRSRGRRRASTGGPEAEPVASPLPPLGGTASPPSGSGRAKPRGGAARKKKTRHSLGIAGNIKRYITNDDTGVVRLRDALFDSATPDNY